jgi:hypothetical protein
LSIDPSAQDLIKYAPPLLTTFKWTKANNSKNIEELQGLEKEYGLRFIEATGSLNYLSNSYFETLFTARMRYKHMHLPGRAHFKALIHYFNHIRFYPLGAMDFYHNVLMSPLATLLKEAGHPNINPSFVWFTDSSHRDCNKVCSTDFVTWDLFKVAQLIFHHLFKAPSLQVVLSQNPMPYPTQSSPSLLKKLSFCHHQVNSSTLYFPYLHLFHHYYQNQSCPSLKILPSPPSALKILKEWGIIPLHLLLSPWVVPSLNPWMFSPSIISISTTAVLVERH